jgi:hypothetical protein
MASHWAGLDAQRTADADRFVDHGQGEGLRHAMDGVQGDDGATRELRQLRDTVIATGCALVDLGLTHGHRLRIAAAVRVFALLALRLRQYRVDLVGQPALCVA